MEKRSSWQLQDAKNKLSEVVDEAIRTGPQVITRRGTVAAVLVSARDWARVSRTRGSLIALLRRAPRIAGGLDVARSKDLGRDVDL